MKFDVKSLLLFIKPLLPFITAGKDPAETVRRAITIPVADRMKLYRGMDDDAVAEAERDYKAFTKGASEWALNVATKGTFGADADEE